MKSSVNPQGCIFRRSIVLDQFLTARDEGRKNDVDTSGTQCLSLAENVGVTFTSAVRMKDVERDRTRDSKYQMNIRTKDVKVWLAPTLTLTAAFRASVESDSRHSEYSALRDYDGDRPRRNNIRKRKYR